MYTIYILYYTNYLQFQILTHHPIDEKSETSSIPHSLSSQDQKLCHQILNDFFHGKIENPVHAGIDTPAKFQECLVVLRSIVLHALGIQNQQAHEKASSHHQVTANKNEVIGDLTESDRGSVTNQELLVSDFNEKDESRLNPIATGVDENGKNFPARIDVLDRSTDTHLSNHSPQLGGKKRFAWSEFSTSPSPSSCLSSGIGSLQDDGSIIKLEGSGNISHTSSSGERDNRGGGRGVGRGGEVGRGGGGGRKKEEKKRPSREKEEANLHLHHKQAWTSPRESQLAISARNSEQTSDSRVEQVHARREKTRHSNLHPTVFLIPQYAEPPAPFTQENRYPQRDLSPTSPFEENTPPKHISPSALPNRTPQHNTPHSTHNVKRKMILPHDKNFAALPSKVEAGPGELQRRVQREELRQSQEEEVRLQHNLHMVTLRLQEQQLV